MEWPSKSISRPSHGQLEALKPLGQAYRGTYHSCRKPRLYSTLLACQKRQKTCLQDDDSDTLLSKRERVTAVSRHPNTSSPLAPSIFFLSTRQESWKIASDEIHAAGTRLRHQTDQSSILRIDPHGSQTHAGDCPTSCSEVWPWLAHIIF